MDWIMLVGLSLAFAVLSVGWARLPWPWYAAVIVLGCWHGALELDWPDPYRSLWWTSWALYVGGFPFFQMYRMHLRRLRGG